MDVSNVSNEEQQVYINAKYELEELLGKTVLGDDEYNAARGVVVRNGDATQLEQFDRDYVSQSDYDRKKADLEEIIKTIDEKLGNNKYRSFDNPRKRVDRNTYEKQIRARRERGKLKLIKRYYENRNQNNIMRDVDVDALSDDEVIDLYRRVTRYMEPETLAGIIRGGVGSRTTEDVNTDLRVFINKCDEFIEAVNKVKGSLVLGDGNSVELNDIIRDLGGDLKVLGTEADALMADIDAFRSMSAAEMFKMTPAEINAKMKDLKERFKALKANQIDRYNARVEAVNKRLEELRGRDGLDPEIASMLANLSPLARCDATVGKWDQVKYLEQIDYNKIVELSNALDDIEIRMGVRKDPNAVNFDDEMEHIERNIVDLENAIKPDMTPEMYNMVSQGLQATADDINSLLVKIEENKDKLGEEKYNEYKDRLNDAQANLADLNKMLPKTRTGGKDGKNNVYEELKQRLANLGKDITSFDSLISGLKGNILPAALVVLDGRIHDLSQSLDEIEKEIEEKHKNGEIDDTQYANLTAEVAGLRQTIENTKTNLRTPEMIKDTDVFAFLNGQIDGVEKALDSLEKQVDALEKPIKNKETRKAIDRQLEKLENEVKRIEDNLEAHKEDDIDKYNATKERLDSVKERINKLSQKYRKKCPLLVRAAKSAKNFYKNHKKLALIIAGLVAIAIVHATVGPIIIPAIMHGNLMIGHAVPALRGFLGGANKILGGAINAHIVNNMWTLANGVTINPACAASSLLKGIAISGIGTTLLAAPVIAASVAGVKALVEKMKTAELKEKMAKHNAERKAKREENKAKRKAKLEELKAMRSELGTEKPEEDITLEGTTPIIAAPVATEETTREFNPEELAKEFITDGREFEEYAAALNLDEEQQEKLKEELAKYGFELKGGRSK